MSQKSPLVYLAFGEVELLIDRLLKITAQDFNKKLSFAKKKF